MSYDGGMRWLSSLAICSLVSLAWACGGAEEQDVLGASSGADGTGGTGASPSSSGGDDGAGGGGNGSGGVSSGGGASSSNGGSPGGPGPNPGFGPCTQETEPNNEPKQANELVTSVCGVLSPGSEYEWLTFELPEGTKTMGITFDGDIEMRVIVEGRYPIVLNPKSSPPLPLLIGQRYFVEVTALYSTLNDVSWRVTLNRT